MLAHLCELFNDSVVSLKRYFTGAIDTIFFQ